MRIALALRGVVAVAATRKCPLKIWWRPPTALVRIASAAALQTVTQQIHEILISTMFFWPFGHKIRDLLLFSMLWSALKETLSRGKQVSFKYLKYHWKCTITSLGSDHFVVFFWKISKRCLENVLIWNQLKRKN